MKIATIALRNIFRNKRRSLLSLSAIAIATMVIVLMFSLIEGMKQDQQKSLTRFVTGEVRLRNKDFEQYQYTFPEEFMIRNANTVLQTIRNTGEITHLETRIQFRGALSNHWENIGGISVVGDTAPAAGFAIDFTAEDEFFSIEKYILAGGKIPQAGELLIGDVFAQNFNVKPGDTLFLQVPGNMLRLTVSGLIAMPVEQLRQKTVFIPLATAQEAMALEDQVQEILLAFREGADLAAETATLRNALDKAGYPGFEIQPWYEVGLFSQYLDLANVAFNFVALFFFIIATTVIVNTTMMVIYERMREIGTLRAMGMKGKEMIFLFFSEAFFISLAAAFTGVLVGVGIVIPLSINGIDFGKLADLGKMDLGISNVIYPQLNLQSTLFVFVYAVAVSSLITFIPTRRAAAIEPIEALRAL